MADPGAFGSASVVVFGLLSAVSWGAADFGGGLTSRRSTLFGVILVSQVAGMLVALALAVVRGERLPGVDDAIWSIVAGLLAAVGITGLYGGLAVGRMAVVAPVTAVFAALIPVAFGIAVQGLPGTIVLAGIGLAIVAVILVSRAPSGAAMGGRSGIELALVGGLGLGLFTVAISRVDAELVFGPLAIVRTAEASAIAIAVLATRRPARVPAALIPAVLLVGALDMAGNAGFLFARQTGPLAVAAVLSSLYPVMTIILAGLVLRERLSVSHGVGIAAAVGGVVLIGAGSVHAG